MGEKLDRYVEDRACLKCGASGASSEFMADSERYWKRDELNPLRVWPVERTWNERIARKCPRCGWTWYEAPLDSK